MNEAYFADIALMAAKYTQSNSVMDFFHMELPEQIEALREFCLGEIDDLASKNGISPDEVIACIAYAIVNA